MKLSQNDTLLNYMANGKGVSRLEALLSFSIQNITARIRDLRKAGVDVSTKLKRDPRGAEYAEYFITPNAIYDALSDGIVSDHTGLLLLNRAA